MPYTTVIDALSANDLVAARDVLLDEILQSTSALASWDSEYYRQEFKEVQQSLILVPERNKNFTYFGLENFRDRYALRNAAGTVGEEPQMFFARVATGMARASRRTITR